MALLARALVVRFALEFHWPWEATLDLTPGQAFDYLDVLDTIAGEGKARPAAIESQLEADFGFLDRAVLGW